MTYKGGRDTNYRKEKVVSVEKEIIFSDKFQLIDSLIVHFTNKRWIENKNNKHSKNALEGWYRYDTYIWKWNLWR